MAILKTTTRSTCRSTPRGIVYTHAVDRITGESWKELSVELPARMTEQWMRHLSDAELNAAQQQADKEREASEGFTDHASRRTARRRVNMLLEEYVRRHLKKEKR